MLRGVLVSELTPPDFGYRSIVGLDPTNDFVYVAGDANPTERTCENSL